MLQNFNIIILLLIATIPVLYFSSSLKNSLVSKLIVAMLLAKLFMNYFYYKYLQIISIYNVYFYILYLFSICEIRHQCLMQIKQKFKIFLHSILCVTWLLNFFSYLFLFSKLKIKTYCIGLTV